MTVVHGWTTGWFPDGQDFHIGLVWTETDPFAVRLDFTDTEGGVPVRSWETSRELLREADLLRDGRAGEGDIVISASTALTTGLRHLTLMPGEPDEWVLLVGWRPVKAFLRDTARLCPYRAEDVTADVDAFIAELTT